MNIGSTESDKRYEVVLKHYSAAFTRCYAVPRKSEVGIAGFAGDSLPMRDSAHASQ
jgi:hypothetical protein